MKAQIKTQIERIKCHNSNVSVDSDDSKDSIELAARNELKVLSRLFGPFLLVFLIAAALWSYLPVHDSMAYFDFVDQRTWGLIPHAGDVLTNFAFLIVGVFGLKATLQSKSPLRPFGILLSVGTILTSFGSTYFHYHPNPETLLWDRLPMLIVFGSLAGLVVSDRLGRKSAGWFTAAMMGVLPAIALIFYQAGIGSIRPYIVAQYGGILFIALIAMFFPKGRIPNGAIWTTFGLYSIAKIFEMSDGIVYQAIQIASGHNLKHIFAALALAKILSVFAV